jgi:hypothetical protein
LRPLDRREREREREREKIGDFRVVVNVSLLLVVVALDCVEYSVHEIFRYGFGSLGGAAAREAA